MSGGLLLLLGGRKCLSQGSMVLVLNLKLYWSLVFLAAYASVGRKIYTVREELIALGSEGPQVEWLLRALSCVLLLASTRCTDKLH